LYEAKGELAHALEQDDLAIEYLKEAVKRQDALLYIEPPTWYHAVRLTPGTVLLETGNAEAAEPAFRGNLEKFPDNGWALYGLSQSLQQQGQLEEATELGSTFLTSWRYAEVDLTAPRF